MKISFLKFQAIPALSTLSHAEFIEKGLIGFIGEVAFEKPRRFTLQKLKKL